jgi:dTMP kinase
MFVVFEGIDGSGKTTISNLVVDQLRARGLSVKHLRAEGKFVSTVSESIRALARDSRNLDLVPRAEFLLYVARDVQLIEEALHAALATHDVVIADRFLYTAEVLARFGRGLSKDYVAPVLMAAANGVVPELVVLVDVDPVLARARRKASKLVTKDQRPPSRKGLSGVGLQHRLRRGYLELARETSERWVTLQNEAALETSVQEVTELIDAAVREGAAPAIERHRQRRQATTRDRQVVDSAQAALRHLLTWLTARAEREPQVAAYVLGGLSGPEVDGFREALASRVPEVILAGLQGLTDDASWRLRERLRDAHPAAVARSLGGGAALDSRAQRLREQLVPHVPVEVLKTLARIDAEDAWSLRERLRDSCEDAVMDSLCGLANERAWEMRNNYLARYESELKENYERARSVARSVQEVEGDRAWSVRESAWKAAPLSCLSSLAQLTCERSFATRGQYLSRAPKIVMETMKRMRDARAWEMRRKVALEIKEVVDSVSGLDDDEAWDLRTLCADVWPSTVIKTLGQLADGERGQRLLRRQLEHHGENVSLLKHAAAIALGAHLAARHLERMA